MWLFLENFLFPLAEVVGPAAVLLYSHYYRKKEKLPLWPVYIALALALPIAYGTGGLRFVSTGHWGIETQFGEVLVDRMPHSPGLTWMQPWRQLQQISSRQQQVHPMLGANKDLQVVAKDGLLLTVDADLSMLVNREFAGHIYSAYGTIEQMDKALMIPASHAAVKNSGLQFEGKAAWETDRIGFQTAIHDNFVDTVYGQLGMLPEFRSFDKKKLRGVFTFPPALLGPTLPPSVVTDQVANFRAADQAKMTQDSLTQVAIAKQQTATQEALVIARFFEGIPEGISLSEIATYENSRSFAQLVADKSRQIGPVTIMIASGDQAIGANATGVQSARPPKPKAVKPIPE